MTGAAPDSPGTLGKLTSLIGKALGRMTPEERATIIADASVTASDAIGKAGEMLNEGDDHTRIGMVEDLWDGPPDDRLRTTRGHGPGSSVPPGAVGVGPSQAAAGNNAPRMENQYSNHAGQTGVQRATERLGHDLIAAKSAIRSMLTAFEAMNTQIETLKAGQSAPAAPVDIDALVTAAVQKAMAPVLTEVNKSVAKAVAKAWEKKDDDKKDAKEDDDEADEKSASAVNKADEKEKEKEEGKDDEAHKSAVDLRLLAKSYLKWASRRVSEAGELEESGKPKSAARHIRMAHYDVGKAEEHIEAAKALLDGQDSPKTDELVSAVAKAKHGLPPSEPEMQTTWPVSNDKRVGKAADVPVTPAPDTVVDKAGSDPAPTGPSMVDFQRAMSEINKAASGFALLQASVGEMFSAMSSQSRGPTDGLPPVFALAKAGSDDLSSREAEIMRLAEAGTIGFGDMDGARDVIGHIRSKVVPQEIIKAKIARLPAPAQAVLLRDVA